MIFRRAARKQPSNRISGYYLAGIMTVLAVGGTLLARAGPEVSPPAAANTTSPNTKAANTNPANTAHRGTAPGTGGLAEHAGKAPPAPCHHVRGPFRVRGAHVVTGSGRRFVPYGINLTGLRHPRDAKAMRAQVDAAATSWCANLVRLGFLQERHINHAFLSALRSVVRRAENDGLVVVITVDSKRAVPDGRTRLVWRRLTGRYGHDRQVIFDLFNEPAGPWDLWHNRMEHLARYVRHHGGRNLFWVEGPYAAGSLGEVPRRHLTGVGPVAYSEHRPPWPHTLSSWKHSFGFLARRYPVVEGEWANYSRANAAWACWDDAPRAVPRFLRYLARHKLGLVGYDLAGPRLLESASLADPNRIRADWTCSRSVNEGAGQLIMSWLHSHNG